MDPLAQLLAEREILRCLQDYCIGIDTCDVDLIASVYHPDSYDDHGSFQGTGQAFAEYVAPRLRRFEATQHSIGPSAIDFVDDTTAKALTYVEARHVLKVGDEQTLITFGGEYHDTLALRDGAWKIADRRVVRSWDQTEPNVNGFPPGQFTERARVD